MTLPTCEGQLYNGILWYPKDMDILDMVQVEGRYVCPVQQQEQAQLIRLARRQPALGLEMRRIGELDSAHWRKSRVQ